MSFETFMEYLLKPKAGLAAATVKANTQGAGADAEESDLSADAGRQEDGGLVSKPISTSQWTQRSL